MALALTIMQSGWKQELVLLGGESGAPQEVLDCQRDSPFGRPFRVGYCMLSWSSIPFLIRRRSYLAYCSSLTFSIHSTFLPLTMFVMAIWPMELVAVAPCQCFTP